MCVCVRDRETQKRQSSTSTILKRKLIEQFSYDTYTNHMKAIFRKLLHKIQYISAIIPAFTTFVRKYPHILKVADPFKHDESRKTTTTDHCSVECFTSSHENR